MNSIRGSDMLLLKRRRRRVAWRLQKRCKHGSGNYIELLADIAVPRHQTITEAHVKALEDAIDQMMAAVPHITAFVLPGGHPLAAALQYGRAVARRAERSLDQITLLKMTL